LIIIIIIIVKVCTELEQNLLAIITIGKWKTFETVRIVAKSLNVPIVSINSDEIVNDLNNNNNKTDINLYPTVNHLMKATIDLIIHLKWRHLFVLFQEPQRVEQLIRFADYNYPQIFIQFKIISRNSTNWVYLINYIKSTGYSNLIIDLDDEKLISEFLETVYIYIYFT